MKDYRIDISIVKNNEYFGIDTSDSDQLVVFNTKFEPTHILPIHPMTGEIETLACILVNADRIVHMDYSLVKVLLEWIVDNFNLQVYPYDKGFYCIDNTPENKDLIKLVKNMNQACDYKLGEPQGGVWFIKCKW